jgi:hypothetical protein
MKCQVLSKKGRRCRNEAEFTLEYFGDEWLYDSDLYWVRIFVCQKHRGQHCISSRKI